LEEKYQKIQSIESEVSQNGGDMKLATVQTEFRRKLAALQSEKEALEKKVHQSLIYLVSFLTKSPFSPTTAR
jgi:hypothetical protein